MNTTLTTTRGQHEHPPQHVHIKELHPVRRVGLLDRIALHVGVALIKWGRRPYPLESRERRADRIEQYFARLAREESARRLLLLTLPPR